MTGQESPVIEIHDPAIDAKAVLRRVATGVQQRRMADAYGPDPTQSGPEVLRPAALLDDKPAHTHFDRRAPNQALIEMTGYAPLQGWIFTSRVPVFGRVVAAVRNVWSWMAARWLDQHLMNQQTAFNQAAVRFSGELMNWQDTNLWRVRELEAQIRHLEARLARLEDIAVAGKEDEQ